ncbi:MAG: ABC transporter ATP-binding protein [Oribacterium sp.]|nr:ABC transporter ATP-binding protein [Oribacterium sp.]
MLTIDHVTKKYGKFTALNDISLQLESGVYGLLAPNGAGKTTLIKLITTLLFPTSGQILWNGNDIVRLGEEYRALLGYLPQEFGYYPGYTPKQFLQYVAVLQCIPKEVANQRIKELLELVGMSKYADTKMRKFSGGMKQRIGIAQAMLNDPRILILDEPTAGLDPKERVRFRNMIHSLSKDRIVILSTHIVSDIETIASNIIMIKDHQILCCESPQSICHAFDGRVFEIPAGVKIPSSCIHLSERQESEGTVIRVFSKSPVEEGIPVTPNLEDVFLTIYQEGEE